MKEAYLDLSKPYKQKNPQSAPKKDNQATTILKEVAGTGIKKIYPRILCIIS
jgi:hypothetical protein